MTDNATHQKENSILFASKASYLLQEKKVEEALNLCETGVRQFPFYSPGHYTLALCYEALGKPEDAKNEFERTLVYDPSHNKAMRKLSYFYRKSGLDQMADELLIKEALYSPLNPEIIQILKEKNLYDYLNPASDDEQPVKEVSEEEVDLADEINTQGESIRNILELEDAESETAEEVQQEETESDDEAGPIHNLDPLADEVMTDDEDFMIDNPQDSIYAEDDEDLPQSEDFSPLMQGYLEQGDDEDDDEQWMEVENLLDNEDELSGADVDPMPEGPKDETEMLLEQLSNDEDDINLEAAVVDPYDHIDLTSDTDRSSITSDEISGDDLAAGIEDPVEKKKETSSTKAEGQKDEEESFEDDGETISEIISEFRDDEDEEIDRELRTSTVDEDDADADVSETMANPVSETDEESESDDSLEDEVTIRDMLENPNLVTPTFGEILIAQHKFSEARHVFVELSKKEPDNTRFMKKIQFLDKFLQAE